MLVAYMQLVAEVPENTRKIVGENLDALIRTRHRTWEIFAHEYQIDKTWLGRVISGKIEPGFYKMVEISKALEVGLNDIYPGQPKKKS